MSTASISESSWFFGENIDRLVTIEMRSTSLAYGKIRRLYDAAVAVTGRTSLTMSAAADLIARVKPGDVVLLVTGAGCAPYLPCGENDGPVGIAVLARALALGLGAIPVFVSEPHHFGPIVASSEAAGIPIRAEGTPMTGFGGRVDVVPAGVDIATWAREEFDRRSPAAIIFSEKLGGNSAGVVHNSTGKSELTDFETLPDFSPLAVEAGTRGVLSIGIGDAGNEIGSGVILEAVRSIQDYGDQCQCPCGGGIATTTTTDHLIISAVSNWGAYGLEAALAHLLGAASLPHGPVLERRILDACLNARGYEALYCSSADLVDCISGDTSVSLAQQLAEMVKNSLATMASAGPAH